MQGIFKFFGQWLIPALRKSRYRWVLIVGSLFYLLSPVDISPDVFPIIGWLDDGMIATILVSEFSDFVINYRNRRQKNEQEEIAEIETV